MYLMVLYSQRLKLPGVIGTASTTTRVTHMSSETKTIWEKRLC